VKRLLDAAEPDAFRRRLLLLMIAAVTAFVLLAARLLYLQLVLGEEYLRLSLNNSIRLQPIDAPRGRILDRGGEVLAENRPSFDVSFTPRDAQDPERVARELARRLDLPEEEVVGRIRPLRGLAAFRPVLLQPDIGRDALAAVEVRKVDMPGVSVQVRLRRQYPLGPLAGHVVGHIGEVSAEELKSGAWPLARGGDFIGKTGIERACEPYLRGEAGGRQVEVNASGQVMRVLQTVSPRPGRNVILTLDSRLQRRAEELLEQVAGAAVAVHPATGEVLALASSPGFDPNAFVGRVRAEQWEAWMQHPHRPLENKALQGEYPPGSTFKIVTALAALEEKAIDEATTFDCEGFLPFAGRDYRCWKKEGHGRVDVRRALAESCDVFFYRAGLRLGIERLAWYAKAMGLGSRTGIDLENEARGLIPSAAWKKRRFGVPWQEGETLSVAIGQGYVLATPLQMAMLTAAVADGGVRRRPQLVRRVETAEGEVVWEAAPAELGRLPVGARALTIVRQGLWGAVNGERGTARRAALPDVEIAGKTGTSQVVGRREGADEVLPLHLRPHAWFVCYAPYQAPQIAVAVVVENGEHGSSAAGPIARELVKTWLRQEPEGGKAAAGLAALAAGAGPPKP